MKDSACRISPRLSRSAALPFAVITAAWLFLALGVSGLQAQTFDASNLRDPTNLAAKWLVRAGDDPSYARPDFDDSSWMQFDSTKDLRDLFPQSHPAIVWYRLHVKAAPTQADLALEESNISSAFEIYANGVLLTKLGQIQPLVEYTSRAPILVPIPEKQIATGSFVIALRVYIARSDWVQSRPGFDAENLSLGREQVLRDNIWVATVGSQAGSFVAALLLFGNCVIVLALFSAQRSQKEFLWLGLQSLVNASIWFLNPALYNYSQFLQVLNGVSETLNEGFAYFMYFAFLRRRVGWRTKTYLGIAGLVSAAAYLPGIGLAPYVSWSIGFPVGFLTHGVIPILLILQLRRGNREAGILLIPSLVWGVLWWATVARNVLRQIPSLEDPVTQLYGALAFYKVGRFDLSLFNFGTVLYLLSFAIIIVLRSGRLSRQQAVIEGELEAAREVQQVIVPEQIGAIPGFAVESVYQPAQQVGGDFFQILPDGEGGLLVVIGDVAGKGLPAAMLVSVLVGAIRATAEFTKDPAELLGHLNERLVGRTKGGFSTTLATHITADGVVSIANAGHLAPYLDGREVEIPGALPLGILKGANYEATHFSLAEGSRLTFYTDGVVEAQNQKGELFGFERGRSVSTRPAVAIVEEAKQFGQADDITVVIVERLVAVEEASASGTAPILAPAWESMASEPPA